MNTIYEMTTTLADKNLTNMHYRNLHLKNQLSVHSVAYVEPMQLPMLLLPSKQLQRRNAAIRNPLCFP